MKSFNCFNILSSKVNVIDYLLSLLYFGIRVLIVL